MVNRGDTAVLIQVKYAKVGAIRQFALQHVPHKLRNCYIVLVLFPNSNLSSAKTRPALIVQADDLQTGLHQVIIAMISSQMF